MLYIRGMTNATPTVYSIPLRYRKMENLHIVFWLFKDIGWCLVWQPLGYYYLYWKARHKEEEQTM